MNKEIENIILRILQFDSLKVLLINCLNKAISTSIKPVTQNMDKIMDGVRKFHNVVKQNLITEYSIKYWKDYLNQNGKVSLLDISCGVGGDILKWINADISYVFAFDILPDSIKEAIKRYNQSYKGNPNLLEKLNFQVGNVLEPSPQLINELVKFKKTIPNNCFSLVSCQFAFHYFCKDEESIRKVLQFVSSNLCKGGYFIGTTTDSMEIKNRLKGGSNYIVTQNGDTKLVIEGINDNTYKYWLKSPYFDERVDQLKTTDEYYVNFDVIKDIAREYSLKLIKNSQFTNFPPGYTNIQKEISSLNCTFVFQKK